MSVIRPDGIEIELLSHPLPYANTINTHNERIFSTDNSIKKNLLLQTNLFNFDLTGLSF